MTVHLKRMDARFCYQSAIFIKIVISVQSNPVYCKIINVPYLRCCRQTPQIVHKIISVKFLCLLGILCIRFLICLIPKHCNTFQMLHMWTAGFEFPICIMVIISVKYSSVYFIILKIMDLCLGTSGTIHIQTVKSVTFHHIFTASVSHGLNLCLPGDRCKTLLCSHNRNRQSQCHGNGSGQTSGYDITFNIIFRCLSIFSHAKLLLRFLFTSHSQ